MSDFSNYGDSCKEWLALEQTLPAVAGPEMPLGDVVRLANEEREANVRQSMIKLGPQVQKQDHSVASRNGGNVQLRSYRPIKATGDEVLPLYIHLQGGGFMYGTLDSEDAICARIAIGSKVVVLNVNYRHTPEFTYPTQWNDAEDAFEWAHDNMDKLKCDSSKVVLGGISAGAWVAASLTLQRHLNRTSDHRPPIAGQILMIPCLAHVNCYEPQLKKMRDPSISSYKQNEFAPMFSLAELRWFTSLLNIKNPDVNDLKINPGNASPEQVKGMPPSVIGIAGLDPLRDEGLLYAKMLTEAGVPTDVNLFVGLPHGFRSYEEKLSASARWDKVVEDGICWALSGPSPNEFHVKI
ncbi:ab hydrolase superfamily [Fusarium longipes]|uniref:Ab hydrolase superfamily n=1 Tax=Fusarium longipes TaxID=694270 RepID=A0A395S9H5_9HYPO|nr:ab hydrolase superfamily [Fusarium longipes]